MDSLRDGKSSLVNTNKLVRNYNGCTGLKTGSTSIALYNLSASATRNNLSLIAVVLKAPTPAIRFSNAQKLLDEVSNKKIVETLLQNLSVEDIRLILIEIINQKISIKDNNYVMERMSVYACKPNLIEIVTALKNDLN